MINHCTESIVACAMQIGPPISFNRPCDTLSGTADGLLQLAFMSASSHSATNARSNGFRHFWVRITILEYSSKRVPRPHKVSASWYAAKARLFLRKRLDTTCKSRQMLALGAALSSWNLIFDFSQAATSSYFSFCDGFNFLTFLTAYSG